MPDRHADCEASYVMDKSAAVTSRELMRRRLAGDAVEAAWSAARFLIECMQEADQVSQFLADVRGDIATGRPATA